MKKTLAVGLLWAACHVGAVFADDPRWTLATDDTRLGLTVATNRVYVTSLVNPAQNWEWTPVASEVPLPGANSVRMGGADYTPNWIYCDAAEESNTSYTVVLRFTNAVPALELRSHWRAYTGPGPVENWMTVSNRSGVDVTYNTSISAGRVQVKAGGVANLHRADKTDVGWGVVYNSAIGANANFTLPKTIIPFAVLDVGSSNGLYVGVEWELGSLYVSSSADPLSITVSSLPITEQVTQGNGETFLIPSVYYGAYRGDLDDGCNRFKRWFWNHKVPRSLHDNSDEPWTQNCFAPGAPTPQSAYDAQAASGVECVKWDYWGSGGGCWYTGRDWMYRAEEWPDGYDHPIKAHNAGLKASLYMGGTYLDCDLRTIAGRDLQLEALRWRYDQGWYDMWRTDLYTAPNEPMPQTYNGVKNFLYIHDWLIANRSGYRYENCANGGRYKGFAICRRMTFCTMNDSDQNPVHTRSTYYANSFAINPAQLKSDIGPCGDDPYWMRTAIIGAVLTWVHDTPLYRQHIALYKNRHRPILRGGNVYHILPAPDGLNWDGLEFYNPDIRKGSVFLFKPSSGAGDSKIIRLKGLRREAAYTLSFQDRVGLNCTMSGAALMDTGITVSGMSGATASEIVWLDEVPVAVSASADVPSGMAPLAVQFSATGVATNGGPLTYAWTFGDGGTSTVEDPSHTYTNAGRYIAEVVADDGAGNTATSRVTVTAIGGTHRMFIGWDGYAGTGTLTNFPALMVFGTNLAAKGFAYSQVASSNGWDLMFTDAGMTTVLSHEIERWDTNVLSQVWIRVPRLTRGSGIWAFWGSTNAAAAPPPSQTDGSVWSEGFAGVWHLSDGVSLCGYESTASHNNGTAGSGTTAAAGVSDGAGAFDGSVNGYVGVGTLNPLPAGTGTASIWVNWNSSALAGNNYALAKGSDYNAANSWGIDLIPDAGGTSCSVYLLYGTAAWVGPATFAAATGEWHMVTAVMKANAQEILVDGVSKATGAKATIAPTSTHNFFIGKTSRASPYHYGVFGSLDEARVSTSIRSADWIRAEWLNVASNPVFAAYGTVTPMGGSNVAPTVAMAAQAAPSPVTGTTAALSVLGADDIGETVLTYTWSATGTPPAQVTFIPNGDNAAKNATATFVKAGEYDLQVVIRDPYGAAVTSAVALTVAQTTTVVRVTPAVGAASPNETRQFAALALDQFGDALAAQPAFLWRVSGGGSIDAAGLFTAGAVPGGPHTVTASGGGTSGAATVSIVVPRKILFRFAGYTNRTEVLTNFPVLVTFSNNMGGSGFDYGQFLSSGGYDLRFVTNLADATSLDYEIESWNTNAGQCSYVWVRMPALPPDGSGYVWGRWGDLGHTNQLPCTTNGAVWANGYLGVWHFVTNGSLSMKDSSANGYDGTSTQGTVSPDPGKISGGVSFSGNGDIDIPDISSLNSAQKFSVDLWFNCSSGDRALFSKWGTTPSWNNDILFAIGSGGGLFAQVDNGGDGGASFVPGYSWGTWAHVAMVYDGTESGNSNRLKLFYNGGQGALAFDSGWSVPASSHNLAGIVERFGSYARNASWYENGKLDEIRVSSTPRSADWIWAEWLNMASNAAFVTCGAVSPSGTAFEQWQLQHFTAAEIANPDISGEQADPDGDGMNNWGEFRSKTDPRESASCLRITSAGGGVDGDGFVVRWHSVSNVVYRLERATNLMDGFTNWVVGGITSTPSQNVYTDAPPPAAGAFYRVGVE